MSGNVYDIMHAVLMADPGRVREMALDLEQAESTIYNKFNPNTESHQPTFRDFLHLARHPWARPALARIAADAGCVVVPAPHPGGVGNGWWGHVAAVSKEAGEAVAALARAMEDGKVDDKEKTRVRDEVREAMEALAGLWLALGGKVAG